MTVGDVTLAADDSVADLEHYSEVAQSEAKRVEDIWGNRRRFPRHVLFLTRRKKAMRKWFDHESSDIAGIRAD